MQTKFSRSLSVLLGLWMCFQASTVLGDIWVPSGLAVGDEYHVVFTAQATILPDSPDISFYNDFVQSQAELTGAVTNDWGVNWSAIASTTSIDARDNIPVTDAPIYVLFNPNPTALNAADLWDGTIANAMSTDQFGDDNLGKVWTGTESDGTAFPLGALGQSLKRFGDSGETTAAWVSEQSSSGNIAYSVYAVSDRLTVVPEPGSTLLLGLGLVGLGVLRRRKT